MRWKTISPVYGPRPDLTRINVLTVLNTFLTSFPDVPERAARLLLQIAYVKVSALFNGNDTGTDVLQKRPPRTPPQKLLIRLAERSKLRAVRVGAGRLGLTLLPRRPSLWGCSACYRTPAQA